MKSSITGLQVSNELWWTLIVKGSVFHVISLTSCEISEAPRGASLAQWQSQDLPFVSSFYRDWTYFFWCWKKQKLFRNSKKDQLAAGNVMFWVDNRQNRAKLAHSCLDNLSMLAGWQVGRFIQGFQLRINFGRQSYANKHKIGKTNRNIQTLAVCKNLKDLERALFQVLWQ